MGGLGCITGGEKGAVGGGEQPLPLGTPMPMLQAKPCEAHGGDSRQSSFGGHSWHQQKQQPLTQRSLLPWVGGDRRPPAWWVDAGRGDRAFRAGYEPQHLGKTKLEVTHPSPLPKSRGSRRTGQWWREQDLPGCGGLLLGWGRRKGIYFPLFKGWSCKRFGGNPGCEPHGAGCLSQRSGWLLGQVPASLGTLWPRRQQLSSPFNPLPAHLRCRDVQTPRTFAHPTKGPARGMRDLGHQHPQPILPVLPTAAETSVSHGKSQDTFCNYFFSHFYFFPPFSRGQGSFSSFSCSSLQPRSIPPARMLARLAGARPLLCRVNSTKQAEQK